MGAPRKNFIASAILELLDLDVPFVPFENPYEWLARKKRVQRKQYKDAVRNLKKSGALKIVRKNNQDFLQLTKKGALKILLGKAKILKDSKWDGKWRVVMFDIPEDFHTERDIFRRLLLQHNFKKLQGSVFVHPHTLSRDCVRYLEESGLIQYVRIMRVDEMDNDVDLRKSFNLNSP